jgi:large subunit ribosomal protein L19
MECVAMATTKTKYRRKSKNAVLPLKNLAAKVAMVENPQIRSDLPEFKAGDTVRVHVRIKEGDKERVQVYEGVVIARSNRGGSKSFNVRKISHGVGVERIFLETSPKIAKLEVVQEGRVRRAKLYYLRGLEGKAAKIEQEVETQAQAAASAAAKEKTHSKK